MHISYIAQARMTSSRLPGKVAKDICGKPSLYRMIERMRLTRHDNVDIIIATTTNYQDDIVEEIAKDCGVKVFRGSENHVLSRYYLAAKEFDVDIINRVTCDDLLYDPRWLFDDLLDEFLADGTYDYMNAADKDENGRSIGGHEPCCGCGCEIFTFKGLEKCMNEATDPYCIEHVTPYFYMNPEIFHLGGHGKHYTGPQIENETLGTSLDTQEDLELLRFVYDNLYPSNPRFSTTDIVELLMAHPEVQDLVREIKRTPVTYHGEAEKNK